VNFVTAHDGFTLRDLVSYDEKHNEANGEENRDGESNNRSWNCGVEGPTDDPQILALRARQVRNLLATLLLSQGVPMLLGGDELGRTQHGNNNAYCQDNELSWFDWEAADLGLYDFTRRLIQLRREHPVFRQRRWFQGRAIRGASGRDLLWFKPDGGEMSEDDWSAGFAKSLAVFLNGDAIKSPGRRGERIRDQSFFLIANAHWEPLDFTLPDESLGKRWQVVVDTTQLVPEPGPEHPAGAAVRADGRSLLVLERRA